MAINLLDEHNLAWHIVYECNSVNALWSAVRAGLGITLRANFAIPKDLSIIKDKILPLLPTMTLGLYSHHKIASNLTSYFGKCIINSLT